MTSVIYWALKANYLSVTVSYILHYSPDLHFADAYYCTNTTGRLTGSFVSCV